MDEECESCGEIVEGGDEELCMECTASVCRICFNRYGGLCKKCKQKQEEAEWE